METEPDATRLTRQFCFIWEADLHLSAARH